MIAEHLRLLTERSPEGKIMATSFEERGRLKGVREILQRMLEKRFGPLTPIVLQQLNDSSVERLEELSLAFVDAKSIDELGLGNAPLQTD